MSISQQTDKVPNELVMRLHRATDYPALECWRVLYSLALEDRETYVLAYEAKEDEFRYWVDPIEFDPRYEEILAQVGEEATTLAEAEQQEQEQQMLPEGEKQMFWLRRRGLCHRYWHTKQRILKERFDLDWRTPAEMNPHIAFD